MTQPTYQPNELTNEVSYELIATQLNALAESRVTDYPAAVLNGTAEEKPIKPEQTSEDENAFEDMLADLQDEFGK